MQRPSRHAVVYGQAGQVLDFYPPEAVVCAEGAPTAAATYDVFRWDQDLDDTPLATGTATLDAISTTVNVAAGYAQDALPGGRRRVGLTSPTGIRTDRVYLLANASGQREPVQPVEVAAVYVTPETDLHYDYPIGSTFVGLRHAFTVPAEVYDDDTLLRDGAMRQAPMRVRWTWTTPAGTTRQSWTYFDVVRQVAQHNVTAASLRAAFPDITDHEWSERRGAEFSAQIGAAWDRFVVDLTVAGYPVDALREGPVVDELVRVATILLLAENGVTPRGRDPEAFIRDQRDRYLSLFERAFLQPEHPRAWMSNSAGGEVTPTYVRPPLLVR